VRTSSSVTESARRAHKLDPAAKRPVSGHDRVFAPHRLADSIIRDLEKERRLLQEKAHWRLKPLVPLPIGTYDLIKDRPPHALLGQPGAVRHLMVLQNQCGYTNALVNEQYKWKMPAAIGQPDQLEIIISFHPAIVESVETVLERCKLLSPAIAAAGEKVGMLNLEGPKS
jgi:hypothetical protein